MRHRFHALCPYFAMFPEIFVQKHLVWSKSNDVILDPFSGRGTTVFEALLNGRQGIACDVNPVAACVSRAKAKAPVKEIVRQRISDLSESFDAQAYNEPPNEFFEWCFAASTFKQIMHLKANLRWQEDDADCFVAALALGMLHGESHKSVRYFSNRMPRTISTKPDYSVRWWKKNDCSPPERDVFALLASELDYRYESEPPLLKGEVKLCDARSASKEFSEYHQKVGLVVTSPPYLDVTNFAEDQWLRLWFMGGSDRPQQKQKSDDRHTNAEAYWMFLQEVWSGVADLLKADARLVIRIGGKKLDLQSATEGLEASLRKGLGREIRLVERRISEIGSGQLRSFRPNAEGTKVEFDFHFQLV